MQRIAQFWKSGTTGKLVIGCGSLIVILLVCSCLGALLFGPKDSTQQASEEPATTQVVAEDEPTNTPEPADVPEPTSTPEPEPVGRTMYVCGYDRCHDSGEYRKLISESGINVWNNPDPDRGGAHHQASHADKVVVIDEKRVNDGPGGLWYELEGGGWTNDLWLTDEICTPDNLEEYSFTDCLGGKY